MMHVRLNKYVCYRCTGTLIVDAVYRLRSFFIFLKNGSYHHLWTKVKTRTDMSENIADELYERWSVAPVRMPMHVCNVSCASTPRPGICVHTNCTPETRTISK